MKTQTAVPVVSFAPYFEPRKTNRTSWLRVDNESGRKTDNDQAVEVAFRKQARLRESQLEYHNRATQVANEPIFDLLIDTTGLQLPREAPCWWDWWKEYNEVYHEKPTRTLYDNSYDDYVACSLGPYYEAMSCFAAGTPVATETGKRPVDRIQPGDRVFSQHPVTGELKLQTVMATTIRSDSRIC